MQDHASCCTRNLAYTRNMARNKDKIDNTSRKHRRPTSPC